MLKRILNQPFVYRGLALSAVLSVSLFAAAQDTAPATSPALFSSSTAETAPANTTEASVVAPAAFNNYFQYGGGQRSRYGRPRYRGSNTNQDGSNNWTAYFGAGLQQPIGNTFKYDTPSWAIQGGVGRQYNKNFAVPIEFDYDNMGLSGQTLGNQIALYNNDINYYCSTLVAAGYCAANGITTFSSLDGNAHVWSFSIDPTYTFLHGDSFGAYAVAGVGFYHKVTNFTTPEEEEVYTYYGPEEYVGNAIIDHYSSNAPGFSAGFGLTYKFSRFSNERFYGEVRYVFMDNSYRPGVTVNSPVNSTTVYEANDFPANSNHTTYFPIKVGIRF
jgi:hypothetical protein